ncbi:hypothetical protein [Spirosoma foliorum]|uniref:Uncharacterized protein n=1 Tax=Spirosoma foliorum TaxID=2710596 RepID=A0A7G5GVS7_9BACT|nr:hypothetical protein [Spirosoma foliorum]QMW02969.1 hypothetical protein H3H32_34655 [Spirosoma foliorum]
MNRTSSSFLTTLSANLSGSFLSRQNANTLPNLFKKHWYFFVLISLFVLRGTTVVQAENRPGHSRSALTYATSNGFMRTSAAASRPAACTTPTVSLVNTNAGNCVGAASLSVSSSTPISKVEWYNGTTLVYTALPQAAASVTTVAGGHGQGSAANQLDLPTGLYVDGTGNIFIADQNNHRIQKWSPNNGQGTTVGGGNGQGTAANQLISPADVFLDGAGTLYTTSYASIRKWANGGGLESTLAAGGASFGSAANQFYNPVGVYVDASGAIYVADRDNHRIQKWASGASSGTTVAGGNGQGSAANQLNSPTDVWVDAAGAVYVSDRDNNRVQKWAVGATSGVTVAGGNGAGSAANQLNSPQSLYVDAFGGVYVSDSDNNRVQKWVPGATSGVTVAGGNGYGTAANQFRAIAGIHVDASGAIYVADQLNYRVQKWAPASLTPTYLPTTAGSYTAKITDAYGCTATTSAITITLTTISISPTLPSINAGQSATLNVSGATSYSWSTGQTGSSIVVSPSYTTVYSVIGTTPTCSTRASASVTVGVIPKMTITNVGASTCVGVTSLSVASSSTLTRIDWYNGSIFLTTSLPQSASVGTSVAGGNGAGSGLNQLSTPAGVYVDGAGAVYVADQANHRIQKWAPGATSGVTVAGGNGAGSAANQLNNPAGVAVDAFGAIYVADRNNNRIQKWIPGATSGVTVAGGNGVGSAANQLNFPVGVSVDAFGTVYVADYSNHRVQKWAVDATVGVTVAGGNSAGSAANQLYWPTGVYVNRFGAVYVADYNNHRVQKWEPGASSGTTVAGGNSYGPAPNQLNNPSGVYVDGEGVIYISDASNRIQQWLPGASSGTTVAGGNGQGSATNQFNNASGVAVDRSGTIYIADAGNNRIQQWAPTRVSTYQPMVTGTYTARVTDVTGYTATTNAITVNNLIVTISPSTSVITGGQNAVLTASGATSYTWSTGQTGTGITVSPVASTVYSVTGIAGGCSGTASMLIGVSPSGTLSNAGLSSCVGAASLIISTASVLTKVAWYKDNTLVSTSSAQSTSAGVTVAGNNGEGTGLNQLNNPTGVSVDASGAVYVADNDNHRIQKWTPGATSGVTVAGDPGGLAGSAANQFNYAAGLFVTPSGTLYVTDYLNSRVQKWEPGASSGVTVAGGNGSGSAANQLNGPFGIYVDGAGTVYVVDQNNHRVQKWVTGASSGVTVAGGNGSGSAANQLDSPTGLVLDGTGAIYIADKNNHRIQKWASGATLGTTVAGGNGSGSTATQLNNPTGVFVDSDGAIYVADQNNHRIQQFPANSTQSTSGTTVAGGNGAGSGANQLANPYAVYVNAVGVIYVADFNNHRIQRWRSVSLMYSPITGGSYTAKITDMYGFSATTNAVAVTGAPTVTISPATPTISNGQSATLTASGATSYVWSTGQSGSTIVVTPSVTTRYAVTGTTSGCAGNNTVDVTVNCGTFSTSLVNTALSSCIGVANLAVGSAMPISRLDWYKEATVVFTSTPQSATSGVLVAGTGQGASASELNAPMGIYVDGSGAIYVVDQNNHRIQKWAAGATSGTTVAGGNGAGSAANQLNFPYAVYVDGSGAMYVVDQSNHRIQKWTAGATSGVTVAGGNGAGSAVDQLNSPTGIYMDGFGNMFITDANNHRVQKWAAGATSGTTVAGGNGQGSAANQLNYPTGISVDALGAIYVTDRSNNRIQKWMAGASSGTTVAGGNGQGSAANQFNQPNGLYVDAVGAIYVVDRLNFRVQKWAAGASSGVTVAGGNGIGSAANQMSYAYGVTLDVAGAIYVSEANNYRVQKWGGLPLTYSPTTGGVYSAKVTDIFGCTVTTPTVPLFASPTASASVSTSLANVGSIVNLTASGAASYQWSAPTGAAFTTSATNSTVAASLTSAGVKSFTVVASNGVGCSQTVLVSVTAVQGPDLSPIINLPDANFPVNGSKELLVTVQEVNGVPTNAGAIVVTITVPVGYTIGFSTSITSLTISGGSAVSVDNNKWELNTPATSQQLSVRVNDGQRIGANGVMNLGFTVRRTTANSGSVSSITINVANDQTSGYDSNLSNNVYARIISGL